MKATQLLHDEGQSLWLENITRDLLDSGTVKRYIDELSINGLTSNPTIFDHAIKSSAAYDSAIITKTDGGNCEEVVLSSPRRASTVDALAVQLQGEGADSFVKSWTDLMTVISSRCASLHESAKLKAVG